MLELQLDLKEASLIADIKDYSVELEKFNRKNKLRAAGFTLLAKQIQVEEPPLVDTAVKFLKRINNNKFFLLQDIKEIGVKYDFDLRQIEHYIGDIPDVNLNKILKHKEQDKPYRLSCDEPLFDTDFYFIYEILDFFGKRIIEYVILAPKNMFSIEIKKEEKDPIVFKVWRLKSCTGQQTTLLELVTMWGAESYLPEFQDFKNN